MWNGGIKVVLLAVLLVEAGNGAGLSQKPTGESNRLVFTHLLTLRCKILNRKKFRTNCDARALLREIQRHLLVERRIKGSHSIARYNRFFLLN